MIIVLNWLILVMTFGLVQVADVDYIDNDTSIVELNNYTLNEVFEDNNAIDFTQLIYTNNASLNLTTDYLEITHNGNSTYYASWKSGYVLDGNWYATWKLQSDDNIQVRFEMRFSSLTKSDWTDLSSNDIIQDSYYYTGGYHTNAYVRFLTYNLNTAFKVYDLVMVDLDNLGITLTKDELDMYYNIYQDNIVFDYDYTINTLDMSHVVIIVGSFFLWTWLYKFLKGVVL